jgi:hypothetical protein
MVNEVGLADSASLGGVVKSDTVGIGDRSENAGAGGVQVVGCVTNQAETVGPLTHDGAVGRSGVVSCAVETVEVEEEPLSTDCTNVVDGSGAVGDG